MVDACVLCPCDMLSRRHKISQETRYERPCLQGLSTGTNPNVGWTGEFHPNTGSVAGAWVRYKDGNTGNPYWHNRITNLVRRCGKRTRVLAPAWRFAFSKKRPRTDAPSIVLEGCGFLAVVYRGDEAIF